MGAVDKYNILVSYNDTTRKTLKWYTKKFFHLLDLSVMSAFQMYKKKCKCKIRIKEFRLNMIRQLLEQHFTPLNDSHTAVSQAELSPLCLSGRHFIRPIPNNENHKRKPQRKCYVSSKKERYFT